MEQVVFTINLKLKSHKADCVSGRMDFERLEVSTQIAIYWGPVR